MKIKALSRSVEGCTRQTNNDLKKISRSLDPKHKPMEKAREYTRAITAAKMDRIFAKVSRRKGCCAFRAAGGPAMGQESASAPDRRWRRSPEPF